VLRERIQDILTLMWTLRLPLIQSMSPAQLAATRLGRILEGRRFSAVVDFCSGSGGPTPVIERVLNDQRVREGKEPYEVVMTDLHPSLAAWKRAAAKRERLAFVSASVDAGDASRALEGLQGKKHLRLFSLAFHHFDDTLARKVLRDAILNSDGLWSVSADGSRGD
jgi:hypothetical protein